MPYDCINDVLLISLVHSPVHGDWLSEVIIIVHHRYVFLYVTVCCCFLFVCLLLFFGGKKMYKFFLLHFLLKNELFQKGVQGIYKKSTGTKSFVPLICVH